MADREVEVTKGISNETVCQYFFVLFIIVSIIAGLSVLGEIRLLMVRPGIGGMFLLRTVVVFSLAVANSLFLYVMCARSLLK